MTATAHWERGYRSHGYWLETCRIGFIGIDPHGMWDGTYGWYFEHGECQEGKAKTLRAAKRQIEKLWMQYGEKITARIKQRKGAAAWR